MEDEDGEETEKHNDEDDEDEDSSGDGDETESNPVADDEKAEDSDSSTSQATPISRTPSRSRHNTPFRPTQVLLPSPIPERATRVTQMLYIQMVRCPVFVSTDYALTSA